jgi:hypothetical protein
MLDHEIPTSGRPASAPAPGEFPRLSNPPITSAGDVLPFAPNLIATIFSFGFMVVVPWLLLWLLDWIAMRYATQLDQIDPAFLSFLQGVTLLYALGSALLFLVIGMILQFWQHHKPFASWWPVALAFPVTWGLLLPEIWARGDSVRYWLFQGAVIALAFSVHWLALLIAREAME